MKGQKRLSSHSSVGNGKFLINSTSSWINIPSTMLWFHFLSSLSIRILTFASTKVSQIGERTYGACCLGSQLLPHMPTILPFPILHLQPLTNTSLPCKILLHAYNPPLDFLASIIGHLWNKESWFFKSRHACLAKSESLNKAKSLNPIPPSSLDFVNSSHSTNEFSFSPHFVPTKISWSRLQYHGKVPMVIWNTLWQKLGWLEWPP